MGFGAQVRVAVGIKHIYLMLRLLAPSRARAHPIRRKRRRGMRACLLKCHAPAAATTIKIKSFAGARPAGGVLILLVSGTFSRRDGTPLPRREETPPRPFVLLSAFHY